ncbi:MAG: hypothetical protein P4L51_00330 [Puia sp.]|nr:hypothetical protein [Puia sp.]
MERQYSISKGTKIFYGLIAVGMFCFAIYLAATYNPSVTRAVFLMPLMIAAGSILIVINLFRRKIVIDDHSILCISLFSKKQLELAGIKGCRIGEKAICLEPLSTVDHRILIGNYNDLEKSEELAGWIKANFKDLDSLDLQRESQELQQNKTLGSTETEQQTALKKAKELATAYNVWGIMMVFVLIFINNMLSIVILLVYPIAGAAIMIFSKGLIKFVSNSKRSPYPFIMLGAMLPGFLLLIKSLGNYTLLQTGPLWLPAFVISGIVFVVFFFPGVNKSVGSIRGQVVIITVFSLIYGFGSARQINCFFDNSRPEIYETTVVDHRVEYGKSTSYLLTLGPWGPRRDEKETEVKKSLYNATRIGDTVKINCKQGLLRIPWFSVTKN